MKTKSPRRPLLGAQMSTAGGLDKALLAGKKVDCDVVQIFTKSSRQWAASPYTDEAIKCFKRTWEETGIVGVIAHDSYLLNLGSPDVALRKKSIKGFIDEIPTEYEEAAMVDGYTRFQVFRKIVLPQATTGIAATAVFCFIFAWNEYAFAFLLSRKVSQTVPAWLPYQMGVLGYDWGAAAAGTFLFLLPAMIFTIILRKHLVRGISFGAIRK